MYINNLLIRSSLKLYERYLDFFVDSLFFMGPLLNTRQPQISGQQNSQDFLDIIYTDRFYRNARFMKIAEFRLRLLT